MNQQAFYRPQVTNLPLVAVAKWRADVLDEGFVPFPKRMLRCLGQIFNGPNAMRDLQIVMAVADYARPNLTRHPSYEFLGFIAGCSEDEAKATLAGLRDEGLLSFVEEDDEVRVSLEPLRKRIVELTDDESREHH